MIPQWSTAGRRPQSKQLHGVSGSTFYKSCYFNFLSPSIVVRATLIWFCWGISRRFLQPLRKWTLFSHTHTHSSRGRIDSNIVRKSFLGTKTITTERGCWLLLLLMVEKRGHRYHIWSPLDFFFIFIFTLVEPYKKKNLLHKRLTGLSGPECNADAYHVPADLCVRLQGNNRAGQP